MRVARVWKAVLGVRHTVIERVDLEGAGTEEVLVARVRPTRSRRGRCGRCGRRAPGYDQGEGQRRWRGLDLGTIRVYLEADAPRVACPEHGVVVCALPGARHGSRFHHRVRGHGRVAGLPRGAVGVVGVAAGHLAGSVGHRDPGGHRGRRAPRPASRGCAGSGSTRSPTARGSATCCVWSTTTPGRLVWAGKGHNATTLEGFFDLLGEARCTQLAHVSGDGAEFIHDVIAQRAPQVLCLDAVHVVAWVSATLDAVRRGVWNQLRRSDKKAAATAIKNIRWALLKTPPNLTGDQRSTLTMITKLNNPRYRAYLLKEQLRVAFEAKGERGRTLLAGWLA